jgi:hypothetical protein
MAYKQSPFPLIGGTSPVKQLGLIVKGAKLAIKYGKKLLTKSKPKPKSSTKTFKYNIRPNTKGGGGYLRGKEGSFIPYKGTYTKKGQKITQDFTKKMSLNTPEAKKAYEFLVK